MEDEMDKPATGKREARKAERRAAIIAIAQDHFFRHGYDRTSMSAIAEEMGGSKGTLWSYFASKEELFAAFMDNAMASFRQVIHEILDPAGNVVDVLTMLAEKFIERISQADAIALQRLNIGEVTRFPEIGRIFYDRGPGISRALLTDYLGGRMREGLLREDDPEEAAEMFFDLCAGGHHQRLLWGLDAGNTRSERQDATRVIRAFLSCYPLAS